MLCVCMGLMKSKQIITFSQCLCARVYLRRLMSPSCVFIDHHALPHAEGTEPPHVRDDHQQWVFHVRKSIWQKQFEPGGFEHWPPVTVSTRDPHHPRSVKNQHESVSKSLRDLFKNMKAFCLFLYNWRPPACMRARAITLAQKPRATLTPPQRCRDASLTNKQTPTNTHTHTDGYTSAHLPPNALTSYSERGQSSRDPKTRSKEIVLWGRSLQDTETKTTTL